jgi:solute carrier family 13 (sodium-dependent dicarboxylate transporter), member 2/3/5
VRRRGLVALILGVLVLSLVLPPLFPGLPLRGQRALGVTLITIVLWTARGGLDSGATALLGVALLALTGAAPGLRQALAGFANPVPYFLVGVLAMGVAVAKSGLAERLARHILERGRGRPGRVYLHLVLAMPVLTLLLPSATTRSGILVHIYEEVFGMARVPAGAGVVKAVMLALTSINRLASTALLTGGITPVMSAALIGGMSWTGWFRLMAVPYYAILVLGGILTWALYRRGFERMQPPPDLARQGLTGREWRTLAVVLGASALWLTDALHHLDPALPAILALVALLAPGWGTLAWTDLDRGVGWGNFFVIGASISLAQALVESGAAAWLARGLVGGLPGLGGHAVGSIVLLMVGATLLRAVIPNITGFLSLALPIAMSVGREVGVNPLVCALVVMMTGDAVLYYPVQSASALVIHERGHVSAGEILRFGLWMTAVAYVAILLVALPYWALLGEPLTR